MIKDLNGIYEAFLKTLDDDPEYAMTLVGNRTRGSRTRMPVFTLLHGEVVLAHANRPVRYVGEGQGGASIYEADMPELQGEIRAITVDQIAEIGGSLVSKVRMRIGKHGPELYLKGAALGNVQTDVVTFIVGPDGDLWTWYPGPAMDPLGGNVAVKFD